jgi:hypothetical protein
MKLEELKERLEDGCQKLNLPEPKTSRQGFSFIKDVRGFFEPAKAKGMAFYYRSL